ncbi:MAG: DUF1461 domain-containing protein [Coriobacteriales bacterium]|jgi:integral membrane protein (TIGR01906 family)|nr:DUF1461 domain-containing protein [Coriobacteriales bacterium]
MKPAHKNTRRSPSRVKLAPQGKAAEKTGAKQAKAADKTGATQRAKAAQKTGAAQRIKAPQLPSAPRAFSVLASIVLALWLVGASFMVVLSPPVTHGLASVFVDTQNSVKSHDYLVRIADDARSFAAGDDSVELPLGTDERVAFTPEVIEHLLDVRVVFLAAQLLTALLTVALVVLFVVAVRRWGAVSLKSVLRTGGIIPWALAVVLVVVGMLSFEALFTAMHQLLFAAGTWTFSYDSLLICALPFDFWVGCAVVWAVALIVLCAVSVITSIVLKRR